MAKEKLYGDHDIDLEHSTRGPGEDAPPRIINPYQLQSYGIRLPSLGHIWSLMTGVVDGVERFDVLKGWGGMRENPGTPDGKDLWTPHGRVYFQIDINPGKYFKETKWVGDMPRNWIIHFYLVMHDVINSYCEEIYPFYMHFVVKDSMICPSPIPYMEFFITSGNPTKGNIIGDLSVWDIGSGISKKERKTRY